MFTQLIQQVAALSPENHAQLLTLYRQLFTENRIKKENYLNLIADFPYLITEDQYIIAAFGLDRCPSRHKLIIDGIERFTWCIWDAFFLAQILTSQAEVQTHDPINNTLLTAQWQQDHWQISNNFCASFPVADGQQNIHLRAAFCQFVHLFSHQNSAQQYAKTAQVEIVNIQELLHRSQEMSAALLNYSLDKLTA